MHPSPSLSIPTTNRPKHKITRNGPLRKAGSLRLPSHFLENIFFKLFSRRHSSTSSRLMPRKVPGEGTSERSRPGAHGSAPPASDVPKAYCSTSNHRCRCCLLFLRRRAAAFAPLPPSGHSPEGSVGAGPLNAVRLEFGGCRRRRERRARKKIYCV